MRTLFGPVKIRGQLIVERRPASRRLGHRAPIAACAEQTREADIVAALLPLADSDGTIAEVLARRVMVSVAAGRKRELS